MEVSCIHILVQFVCTLSSITWLCHEYGVCHLDDTGTVWTSHFLMEWLLVVEVISGVVWTEWLTYKELQALLHTARNAL